MANGAWIGLVAFLLGSAGFLALAEPTGGTGAVRTFRVVTTGDAYLVALSASCPASNTLAHCVVLRDSLGYDGLTGASGRVDGHVNHSFQCHVLASATAPAGNALPYPATMAVSDSIVVGFESDTGRSTYYGGRLERPTLGHLLNRIQWGLHSGDPTVWPRETAEWYVANTNARGATPVVSGTVDAPRFVVWNEGGSDVTIGCEF